MKDNPLAIRSTRSFARMSFAFAGIAPFILFGIVLITWLTISATQYRDSTQYAFRLHFQRDEIEWFDHSGCQSSLFPELLHFVDVLLVPFCTTIFALPIVGTLLTWLGTESSDSTNKEMPSPRKSTVRVPLAKVITMAVFTRAFVVFGAHGLTDVGIYTYDARVSNILCQAPGMFIAIQAATLAGLAYLSLLPSLFLLMIGRWGMVAIHSIWRKWMSKSTDLN